MSKKPWVYFQAALLLQRFESNHHENSDVERGGRNEGFTDKPGIP